MPGAIACLRKNIEFALRTTTMMDDKANDNGAAGKATMPMDDDDKSTQTEMTENAKGSKECKHRDHSMVVKVNHCLQHQQKSFAETVQELVGHGMQEFENDLHQHIHLENNILFPKAIAMERAVQV